MSISIVDTTNCERLKGTQDPFILVLKKGQSLFESILSCAEKMQLETASLSGLGALDDVTLAYYHLDRKEYDTKLFKGGYELVSLNGNLSLVDKKPFVHIHAALGTPTYEVVGGHLMDAIVGPTAEITVIPLAFPIHRQYSNEIGLKLMCPLAIP